MVPGFNHLPKYLALISVVLIISLTSACSSKLPSTKGENTSTFYAVFFRDQQVGKITQTTLRLNNHIITSNTLQIDTQFKGLIPVHNFIRTREEETSEGKPLSFSHSVLAPNSRHKSTAYISGNEIYIADTRGQLTSRSQHLLPADFLLHSGIKRKMQELSTHNGEFTYSDWDYEKNHYRRFSVRLEKINDNPERWRVIRTRIDTNDRREQRFTVDKNFDLIEATFSYFGEALVTRRCTSGCEVPLSALRPLDHQMLASPYLIPSSALHRHLRYTLAIRNIDIALPSTFEQRSRTTDSNVVVDICRHCGKEAPPSDAQLRDYLRPNTWIESDDKRLRRVSRLQTRHLHSAESKMEKLSDYVRWRLGNSLQFSGYLTALEAFQSRSGDCTEYALLLAALARAENIPTRVVFGISYSNKRFHGKAHVFIPHAWTQAWIDDRWQSFDAALEKFDSGHIALFISDGRPDDFNKLEEVLAHTTVVNAVQIVPKKGNMPKK